jgi:hypothetical protein
MFSVFLTFLPWAFFYLWLALCQARPNAVALARISRTRALLSCALLMVLFVGLLCLTLNPQALGAVAPRPPVRTSKRLVPPPAAIADPPRLVPSVPGRGA